MDVVEAMEQSGLPNAIHVSAAFASELTAAGVPNGLQLTASDDSDGTFFVEDTVERFHRVVVLVQERSL